jgi:hypothetical protein
MLSPNFTSQLQYATWLKTKHLATAQRAYLWLLHILNSAAALALSGAVTAISKVRQKPNAASAIGRGRRCWAREGDIMLLGRGIFLSRLTFRQTLMRAQTEVCIGVITWTAANYGKQNYRTTCP